MARHHNAEGKQRNIINRVATLERELKAMTKEAPPRPEDVVARQAMKGERPDYLTVTRGNASYRGPVDEHLARVGGRSRSDVVSDRDRQSGSPLGGGRTKRSG